MLFLLFAVMAQAAELKCLAPFDDSSYYQLLGKVEKNQIVGNLEFAYVTSDGLDLVAKMKTVEEEILPGKSIRYAGKSGGMSIKAGADYWAPDKNYQGALKVQFSFDGALPVDAVMTCEIN
ncbi:MAG: hypothetical protein AB7K68_11370 [Bacteriovoracia bacterium]